MPTLPSDLFSNIGGGVSGIFAGIGALDQASLKAQGLMIQSQGTLLSAKGTQLSATGTRIAEGGTRISAESTLLTAEGLRQRSAGDSAESQEYGLAEDLASQNARFTQAATGVRAAQQERQVTQVIGGARAAVGGSGLQQTGSAVDVIADSAAQGALAKHVMVQQGQMTELGFKEQAQSFETMRAAGVAAAQTEADIATKTEGIVPYQLAIANQQESIAQGQEGIAEGQKGIAMQEQGLAGATETAGQTQATGDFIGSALKFGAGILSLLKPV